MYSQKYSAPDLQTPSYQSPTRVNVYCGLVTESCPALCNHMDCSKPGSSLSFTISQNLLKLMSIEWVMASDHPSSFTPFSCPQSFPASGSFPMSQFFTSGGQSIGVSDSTSVNIITLKLCYFSISNGCWQFDLWFL